MTASPIVANPESDRIEITIEVELWVTDIEEITLLLNAKTLAIHWEHS